MSFLTETIKQSIINYRQARPNPCVPTGKPYIPAGWIYLGDDNVRYVLGQPVEFKQEPEQKNLLVIGVNPSTAKPEQDDPTIRKVRNIAKEQGYNGWIMVNIHPQRATNPKAMTPLPDNIAENNLKIIRFICQTFNTKTALFAWGNLIDIFGKKTDDEPSFLHVSRQKIEDLLKKDDSFKNMGIQSYHYSTLTKKGNPRHLLYAPYGKQLIPY